MVKYAKETLGTKYKGRALGHEYWSVMRFCHRAKYFDKVFGQSFGQGPLTPIERCNYDSILWHDQQGGDRILGQSHKVQIA